MQLSLLPLSVVKDLINSPLIKMNDWDRQCVAIQNNIHDICLNFLEIACAHVANKSTGMIKFFV